MNKKPKILILGGTGFLGKSINDCEKIKKNFEITNINSKELDLRENELVDNLIQLYNENTTIIFLSAVKRNLGDSIKTYKMNMDIAMTVVHAIQRKPVKNLIYLSSCAVYGEKNNQFKYSENSKINPTSFYGSSKVAIEELLKLMSNTNRIENLTILRPTTIYGDINIPTYCPSGLVGKSISEKNIELWGDGSELRDFFYIKDFIEVINYFLKNPKNIVLNICSGKSTTFKDLAQKIASKIEKIEIKNKLRTNELVNHTYNNQLLRKHIPELKIENPLQWIDKIMES